MSGTPVVLDANQAVADVAYRSNEVIAIYPITPASPMGEWADQWASKGRPNIWGAVPSVQEMQSEAGAAGAMHGALSTGALTTTFTASQGLLLMIPNMYKIAGELTPAVIHVAARTVATHALSIFCDHSDVMAVRQTGWAMLAATSVQEAADFALIAQAATLESRIPFVHFFDGFRTSHEISKINLVDETTVGQMLDQARVGEHRNRALSPDRPTLRGSAQNPDVFFQAREACNPFYDACAGIVEQAMDRFAELTGRRHRLFEYFGAADADRVVIVMGSAADTVRETVERLNADGDKTGVLAVKLYRPFAADRFLEALPGTVSSIAVLDRTKEPGALGEPLYLDVCAALDGREPRPHLIAGRYGLSSKEFTPAMARAIFDELSQDQPRKRFTVGIEDDVSGLSLSYDPEFRVEADDVFRAVFFGLGSDGTVSANKSSIKIIGDHEGRYVQGYFQYDSKKAGSVTVSHLRFGPRPIRSEYLIDQADFIGCHQFEFLRRFPILDKAKPGAVFLLNSPYGPEEVWANLPRSAQERIIERKLRFHVVDAAGLARRVGLGSRINTIMQTCFFALADVLPVEEAVNHVKQFIRKTYGGRGKAVVEKNIEAVDLALDHLCPVEAPGVADGTIEMRPPVPDAAPEFVREFTGELLAGRGDFVPVSALATDGVFPTATAQWEKRSIADEVPVWDPDVCIQCAKCAMVCPHAAIRVKAYPAGDAQAAPEDWLSAALRDPDYKELELRVTYQTAPEDCTGCGLCVYVCPAKNKRETRLKAINMEPQQPILDRERVRYEYFLSIPEIDRTAVRQATIKGSQLLQPLFEYSGACAGCGETPYLKLATQMFGDRMLVANATGCSSIYGGNLPTTPWSQNAAGRGPAWSNSLFEDNAEFGLGYRLSLDQQITQAQALLKSLASSVGAALADEILAAKQEDEADVFAQRERVARLKGVLASLDTAESRSLLSLADTLVKKSVWIVGGDGWAYDIGYGGLDHILASGRDVNILVLDTEVYSNTGGQASKATPRAAVAKFASGGRRGPKKDLGLHAMLSGEVYVAQVAMGASDAQTVKAFAEAESFPGVSLIIAYSHCIAHGIRMDHGMEQQKAAVRCGHWPLYRFDPRRAAAGDNPLVLDSRAPQLRFEDYALNETRYRMLAQARPAEAREQFALAQADVDRRRRFYEGLAAIGEPGPQPAEGGSEQ